MKHIQRTAPCAVRALLARSGSKPQRRSGQFSGPHLRLYGAQFLDTGRPVPVHEHLAQRQPRPTTPPSSSSTGYPSAAPRGATLRDLVLRFVEADPPAGLSAFNRLGSFLADGRGPEHAGRQPPDRPGASHRGLLEVHEPRAAAQSALGGNPSTCPGAGGPSAGSSTRDPAPWASSAPPPPRPPSLRRTHDIKGRIAITGTGSSDPGAGIPTGGRLKAYPIDIGRSEISPTPSRRIDRAVSIKISHAAGIVGSGGAIAAVEFMVTTQGPVPVRRARPALEE